MSNQSSMLHYRMNLNRVIGANALNITAKISGIKCSFHKRDETQKNIYSTADNNTEFKELPYHEDKKVVDGLFTDNQIDDIFGDPFFESGVTLYDTEIHEKGTMVKIFMPNGLDPENDSIINMVIDEIPKNVSSGSINIYKLNPLG